MSKCTWCQSDILSEAYHDEEWGIPLHDDRKHFEYLLMEVMQCGLSWNLMLKKRETFRMCFDDFDYDKIAAYDEQKIRSIMLTENMIKSERKIRAIINNAIQYRKIIDEFGTFDEFLWAYSKHKTIVYQSHQKQHVASNELSDLVSKELKQRRFKYLGSITVYSHLQACGIINDHEKKCFQYQYIMENYPVEIQE